MDCTLIDIIKTHEHFNDFLSELIVTGKTREFLDSIKAKYDTMKKLFDELPACAELLLYEYCEQVDALNYAKLMEEPVDGVKAFAMETCSNASEKLVELVQTLVDAEPYIIPVLHDETFRYFYFDSKNRFKVKKTLINLDESNSSTKSFDFKNAKLHYESELELFDSDVINKMKAEVKIKTPFQKIQMLYVLRSDLDQRKTKELYKQYWATKMHLLLTFSPNTVSCYFAIHLDFLRYIQHKFGHFDPDSHITISVMCHYIENRVSNGPFLMQTKSKKRSKSGAGGIYCVPSNSTFVYPRSELRKNKDDFDDELSDDDDDCYEDLSVTVDDDVAKLNIAKFKLSLLSRSGLSQHHAALHFLYKLHHGRKFEEDLTYSTLEATMKLLTQKVKAREIICARLAASRPFSKNYMSIYDHENIIDSLHKKCCTRPGTVFHNEDGELTEETEEYVDKLLQALVDQPVDSTSLLVEIQLGFLGFLRSDTKRCILLNDIDVFTFYSPRGGIDCVSIQRIKEKVPSESSGFNKTYIQRHKKVEQCGVLALAIWTYTHLNNKKFVENVLIDKTQQWSHKTLMDYNYSRLRTKFTAVLNTVNPNLKCTPHSGRKSGTQFAHQAGVPTEEICAAAGWGQVKDARYSYIERQNPTLLKVMAGFRTNEDYYVERASIAIPDSLLKLVFPWLEEIEFSVYSHSVKSLLLFFAKVLLQDMPFFFRKYPDHILRFHGIFNTEVYRSFEQKIIAESDFRNKFHRMRSSSFSVSSESEGTSCSIFSKAPENQLQSLEKTIVEYFGKLEQRLSEVETVMRRSPQYLSDSEEYNNSLKEHALRIAKQVAISHKFQIEKDSRKHQMAIKKYNSAINSRLEATTEQLQRLGASAKTNTAILVDSINHATRKKRKRTSSLCQDSAFQLQQNDTPQDTISEKDFKNSSYTSNDKPSDVREVISKRSFQETQCSQKTVSNVPSKAGDSSRANTYGSLTWVNGDKRRKNHEADTSVKREFHFPKKMSFKTLLSIWFVGHEDLEHQPMCNLKDFKARINLKVPTSYFGFANVIKLLGEAFEPDYIRKEFNFDFIEMVLGGIDGNLDEDQDLKKIFNNATSLRTFLTNSKILGSTKQRMSTLEHIVKDRLKQMNNT